MKKKFELSLLLVLLLLCSYMILKFQNRNAQFVIGKEGTRLQMTVKADNIQQILYPWYDKSGDVYYFFIPSFVKSNTIFFDEMCNGIEINGVSYGWGSSFEWQTGEIYQFKEIKSTRNYQVIFMKSENLPSLFVNTESGSMEYLHSNKENKEKGSLAVIGENGEVEYNGRMDKISGRGNSTWNSYKKPYSLTLPAAYSLCGLEAGKKWNLLALCFESDKIHSKLVYDMSRQLGMNYAIECTWVDLYCNGEYQGMYLLTEAVTVGDGRVEIEKLTANDSDISGGYFLEKDLIDVETAEEPYISVNYAMFTIKYPKQPTEEQVEYISGYMRWIERMILSGDTEYRDYVDIDSFADHLILENIALDDDGMVRSTFFYKYKGNDKLYLGPVWDYDRSMGEGYKGEYESPIFMEGMNEWYQALYADEYFNNVVKSRYQQLRPYLQYVLEEQIDTYANEVRASVEMDRIIESANKGYELEDYDISIENLKSYLAQRLKALDALWGEQ